MSERFNIITIIPRIYDMSTHSEFTIATLVNFISKIYKASCGNIIHLSNFVNFKIVLFFEDKGMPFGFVKEHSIDRSILNPGGDPNHVMFVRNLQYEDNGELKFSPFDTSHIYMKGMHELMRGHIQLTAAPTAAPNTFTSANMFTSAAPTPASTTAAPTTPAPNTFGTNPFGATASTAPFGATNNPFGASTFSTTTGTLVRGEEQKTIKLLPSFQRDWIATHKRQP